MYIHGSDSCSIESISIYSQSMINPPAIKHGSLVFPTLSSMVVILIDPLSSCMSQLFESTTSWLLLNMFSHEVMGSDVQRFPSNSWALFLQKSVVLLIKCWGCRQQDFTIWPTAMRGWIRDMIIQKVTTLLPKIQGVLEFSTNKNMGNLSGSGLTFFNQTLLQQTCPQSNVSQFYPHCLLTISPLNPKYLSIGWKNPMVSLVY